MVLNVKLTLEQSNIVQLQELVRLGVQPTLLSNLPCRLDEIVLSQAQILDQTEEKLSSMFLSSPDFREKVGEVDINFFHGKTRYRLQN